MRIKYKCPAPIYVFPRNETVWHPFFPKIKLLYNVLSPNFHIHVSVSNLYIHRIDLPILLQNIGRQIPGHTYMNVELETRPHSVISGNTFIGFSVQCIWINGVMAFEARIIRTVDLV